MEDFSPPYFGKVSIKQLRQIIKYMEGNFHS